MPKTQGSTSLPQHALVGLGLETLVGGSQMRQRADAAAIFAVACLSWSIASAGALGADAKFLLFSGGDLWGHGSFLHGGALWSPGGLDREGFTLKALISGGTYNYLSGALDTKIDGREFVAQVLPGWRFKSGATEIKLFAGLDVQDHHLSPDDPDSKLRGGDAGLRAAFEFWTEPSPATMIEADGSASTVADSYAVHAAVGWRVADRFYLGPEVQAFASDGYTQYRVGAHITALKLGDAEWSAATGYATDDDDRSSAYARFGVSRRY